MGKSSAPAVMIGSSVLLQLVKVNVEAVMTSNNNKYIFFISFSY